MIIAHITDTHIEMPEPAGAGRIRDFENVISHINKLPVQPDLVIHTGDVSHCSRMVEFKFARSVLKRLKVPFHVIPGNKDQREAMANVFGLKGPFLHRCLDLPTVSLILLDTLSTTSNRGAMCADRLAWLQAQLQARSQKPVLVFMHHPTYTIEAAKYPFQFETREMADKLEAVIASAKNIRGIFCGHSHRNTTGATGGVKAMTLTALALDRRKGDYPPEMQGVPVYQLIEVADDGRFETRFQVCR